MACSLIPFCLLIKDYTFVTCHHLTYYAAKSLSHVHFFVTPWTVARQAPLSVGMPQARILEWVAVSFSRGSSRPRD